MVKSLLMRAFGRPEGVLGKLGGIIMARTNQKIAAEPLSYSTFSRMTECWRSGSGGGHSASRRQSVVGPRRRC